MERLLDGGVAARRVQVRRHVALEIGARFDGRFDFDAVLFGRILADVAPFAQPPAGSRRGFAKVRIGHHRIVPHADRKVVVRFGFRAQGRAHPAVDQPFKVGHSVGLLPAQHAPHPFL